MAKQSNKTALDEIWSSDSIGRREEADLLQEFLESEAADLISLGRVDSYVLAIDAAYGEGKSWFLDRLRRQLALSHPVAFFDAWVDDANDEPLIAIMAAIEQALAPFLSTGSQATERFRAASRAMLPIIGKAVAGAGTKLIQRYIGDAIFEDADDELRKALLGKKGDKSAVQEAIDASVEKSGEAIAVLVDKQAEQLIAEYRKRQTSRHNFKANMAGLIHSVDQSDESCDASPLFVIVDELDRCRPSYAIRVLEEIKHFFDIPGVVFIIALHGDQLEKSVNAVYGSEFESKDYLRRFFTRRYSLRRMSLVELALTHWDDAGLQETKFHIPHLTEGGNPMVQIQVAVYLGRFLEAFGATPREVIAVLDIIRIFARRYKGELPIELTYAAGLALAKAREIPVSELPLRSSNCLTISSFNRHTGIYATENPKTVLLAFHSLSQHDLSDISNSKWKGAEALAADRLDEEFRRFHSRSPRSLHERLYSMMREYPDQIEKIGRLFDLPGDETSKES